MTEKMRLTTIWISPDTSQKLLQVESLLVRKNGGTMNPDDAVRELMEFWKKHRSLNFKCIINGFQVRDLRYCLKDCREGQIDNTEMFMDTS